MKNCEVIVFEMDGNALIGKPCCAEAVAVYACSLAGMPIQIMAVCKDHLKRNAEKMIDNGQDFTVKFIE